ncbi:3-isopropylmalate dehydratase large subunit [Nostoc commune]|uniref:3-isopropylmalate dehydratase large subunit n=1 Tax=Nostoc commune TaxID=1178 RepID=UPI0018C4C83D|nr:3-isopropylmalate dehydratase large subunit [Nostoc commune]MBG1262378.1 3-isopropylmalate dehydratase large subunit [Nostoc commune BAE]
MLKTMYDKIWESHTVDKSDEETLIYIDRHLIHEVTSPQAFESLRINNRKVRKPDKTLATTDHIVPTLNRDQPIQDIAARLQVEALIKNCRENKITLHGLTSKNQGIIHVIAPELGFIQPGNTVVCGDSHTSTHGALGSLAFGIGTSEVQHVLTTQTLWQKKSKNMLIKVNGAITNGISSKDIILYIIGKIGVSGGNGYVIEYQGSVIHDLSIEGRMTLCNMSIEAGAKAGLIAPDERLFDYLKGRTHTPKKEMWTKALNYWNTLPSDEGATFDKIIHINWDEIKPQVTWGTNPGQVISIDDSIPHPESFSTQDQQKSCKNALHYMGLEGGVPIKQVAVDVVFIGSCTNSRIEDLRDAATILQGKKISSSVKAIVVPGSMMVAKQALEEGLDKIFIESGFEWRAPGCSMCVGINGDIIGEKQRCASTSNRNFEGRQGKEGRTHLVSPRVAAATAIAGHFIHPNNV